MSENFRLAEAFRDAAIGRDARELIARLTPTVLTRVDFELRILQNRMVEMDDTISAEFRKIHMRAQVLGEFFRQFDEIQAIGQQADALLEQHHNDAADELPVDDPRVDNDE